MSQLEEVFAADMSNERQTSSVGETSRRLAAPHHSFDKSKDAFKALCYCIEGILVGTCDLFRTALDARGNWTKHLVEHSTLMVPHLTRGLYYGKLCGLRD